MRDEEKSRKKKKRKEKTFFVYLRLFVINKWDMLVGVVVVANVACDGYLRKCFFLVW